MPLRAPGGRHALIGRHRGMPLPCRPLRFDLSAPHADAGGAQRRPISDRISANICLGTATSAISRRHCTDTV
jgi:hypothetical protein